MAETQDVLMGKVEKLTELVAAQSLKMDAQSEAMDSQSVQVTTTSTKLLTLHEESENAGTARHLMTSPVSDA